MATYRVLAVDGGGIRGVVTTVLLERIVATPGLEGFLDSIDLVAGTSTGGLIALGIAGDLPLHAIRAVYVERAYKVGLDTSAAPGYFPSVDGFIDGGVYASNPSMCALAQTQDARYAPTPGLGDVVLLSLGTGTSLQYVRGSSHDWGYAQWVKPLISLMLDGTTGIADYQCSQMLGGRYHRLAPVFPAGKSIPLDYLVDFASSLPIGATLEWIRTVWSLR